MSNMEKAQTNWERFQEKLKSLPQWAYFLAIILWLLPLGTIWTYLFFQFVSRRRF